MTFYDNTASSTPPPLNYLPTHRRPGERARGRRSTQTQAAPREAHFDTTHGAIELHQFLLWDNQSSALELLPLLTNVFGSCPVWKPTVEGSASSAEPSGPAEEWLNEQPATGPRTSERSARTRSERRRCPAFHSLDSSSLVSFSATFSECEEPGGGRAGREQPLKSQGTAQRAAGPRGEPVLPSSF